MTLITPHNSNLSGKSILTIDDDLCELRLLELVLTRLGCQVYQAPNGQTGLQLFYSHQPDLIILDVCMPYLDGWEVCRRIRQLSSVPILMLTALAEDKEIIRGLAEGADDYMVKPYNLNVLIARMQAVLRRVAWPPELKKAAIYEDGYLTLDLCRQEVWVCDQPVSLTKIEYRLLVYLYRHANHLLPHQQILAQVWGPQAPAVDVLHKNIWRLRQKLEADPGRPRYLVTRHGLGYLFQTLPVG